MLLNSLSALKNKDIFSAKQASGLLLSSLMILTVLFLEFSNSFDERFQIRGNKGSPENIIIIELTPSDIRGISPFDIQDLLLLNTSSEINDSYYWNAQLWHEILRKILSLDPSSVYITLDLRTQTLLNGNSLLNLPMEKVRWTFTDPSFALNNPLGVSKRSFTDGIDLVRDSDGVYRRSFNGSYLNFLGDQTRYNHLTLRQLMEIRWPPHFFENKIIIVGGVTNFDYEFVTPMGPFSRSSLLAMLIENKILNQKIFQFSKKFLIILISLIFLVHYIFQFLIGNKKIIWPIIVIVFIFIFLNYGLFSFFSIWFPFFSTLLALISGWAISFSYWNKKLETETFELIQKQKSQAEVDQFKSLFISLMSHDLKNPLTKIQSVVERSLITMNEDNTTLPIIKDLKSIRTYSLELEGYIRTILNLANLEAKEVKLRLQSENIEAVLARAIEKVQELANEKMILFNQTIDPCFPIELDAYLIEEALINLLQNAVKYSNHNSEISVKVSQQNDYLQIEIQDFGIGISPDDLKRLGEKYYRAPNASMTHQGSGLGLYLVKYFIGLHSGEVRIASKQNAGTTVTLLIPYGGSDLKPLN